MFRLNLNQFAHPGSCGGHETDNKIPEPFPISSQALLKIHIICVTDYIFQIRLLLYLDRRQCQFFLADCFQITVYCPYPQIHGFRFVVFKQEQLVFLEIAFRHFFIPAAILFNRI